VKDCPCFSGRRYVACCGPLHARERDAQTPEELMRSRFSAFALGRGEYLVDTLSHDHPDRATPNIARELSRVRERQRFLGLRIYPAEPDEVLFYARIFERGADRSFAELSTFVRENGTWRYASGISRTRAELPEDLETLERADLLEF
jgi:SEC-C motif-containing protein